MKLLTYFSPIMPQRFVYMLQQVEYDSRKFLSWLTRFPNLYRVTRRRRLVYTKKAKLLIVLAYGIGLVDILVVAWLLILQFWIFAALMLLGLPLLIALVLGLSVAVGNQLLYLIRRPLLGRARAQLRNHPAVKIAVLGSYGKTTMKELLLTVLEEGKRVKATPGNMNVPISHARWVTSKVGVTEEVLIFEYGEGKPGDIKRFADLTNPSRGVITGIAPNHLDHYPSLKALGDDLLSIRQTVIDDKLLLNAAASQLHEAAPIIPTYGESNVGDWLIDDVRVDYEGTKFVMKRGDVALNIQSGLLGRHQVGPLAAVAAMAHDLGLTPGQIQAGTVKTQPFEHRMEPRQLQGAWIIDDTYNGNLEGIRAGLRLINDLTATRRIYVTPGLVDQGSETQKVHEEIGRLIAEAKPDRLILMKNSVTGFIQTGLKAGSYAGEVVIEDDPLKYYTGLEHTLAAGDLVIMQNDWTDNYL